MSATVINSTVLLLLTLGFGTFSILAQTFFWRRSVAIDGVPSVWGLIKQMLGMIKDQFMVWSPRDGNVSEYNHISFTRLSVTVVLMLGLTVLVLATYDSVSSFWVYAILYIGAILLLIPILAKVVTMIMSK